MVRKLGILRIMRAVFYMCVYVCVLRNKSMGGGGMWWRS